MYPEVSTKTASYLNQTASTLAGIIFLSTYLFLFESSALAIAIPLIIGMIIDSSTVPYVHSGIISERYNNLKYSDLFIKIHVPPAAIGYGSMLLFVALNFIGYKINVLFYIFALCWLIVYVTGVAAFVAIEYKHI